MQKAVLISRGTCWRKGPAFALCSPLSFTIIMGPSFREGRICRYVSWSYSEREIGMLFDSEMYIGFAGIVLSVDDVNQYWSLVRPVLVDDSYQYWSAVWPVLLASLTSTGSFCDFWKSLYVRISDTLHNIGLDIISLVLGLRWVDSWELLLLGVVCDDGMLPIPYIIYVGDDCATWCRMLKIAQVRGECAKCEYCA